MFFQLNKFTYYDHTTKLALVFFFFQLIIICSIESIIMFKSSLLHSCIRSSLYWGVLCSLCQFYFYQLLMFCSYLCRCIIIIIIITKLLFSVGIHLMIWPFSLCAVQITLTNKREMSSSWEYFSNKHFLKIDGCKGHRTFSAHN